LFNIGARTKCSFYDAIEAINKAKTDDNIKGISIEADDLNAGITQIDDLRNAIEDFKKAENLLRKCLRKRSFNPLII
jgi:protease-4